MIYIVSHFHPSLTSTGKGQTSLANIRLGLKCLAVTNTYYVAKLIRAVKGFMIQVTLG